MHRPINILLKEYEVLKHEIAQSEIFFSKLLTFSGGLILTGFWYAFRNESLFIVIPIIIIGIVLLFQTLSIRHARKSHYLLELEKNISNLVGEEYLIKWQRVYGESATKFKIKLREKESTIINSLYYFGILMIIILIGIMIYSVYRGYVYLLRETSIFLGIGFLTFCSFWFILIFILSSQLIKKLQTL